MKSNRILVVDDDTEILKLLTKYLVGQGFDVQPAASASEMRLQLSQAQYDLIVLDIILPDGNGLDLCTSLRKQGITTPIILLTAMQEDVDRIVGLEMGADDYMGKPFSPRELVARIRAIFRRATAYQPSTESNKYLFEGFTIDLLDRTVNTPKNDTLFLTGAEFEVLRVFIENPGRVLTRDQILDLSRGQSNGPYDRAVDVLISRLRKKLNEEGAPSDLIKTVRNGGYHFTSKVVVSST